MEHPREAPVGLNIFSKSLDCEWKPASLSLPLLDPGVPPGTCRAWLLCLPSISHQGSALTAPPTRPTILERHSAALKFFHSELLEESKDQSEGQVTAGLLVRDPVKSKSRAAGRP